MRRVQIQFIALFLSFALTTNAFADCLGKYESDSKKNYALTLGNSSLAILALLNVGSVGLLSPFLVAFAFNHAVNQAGTAFDESAVADLLREARAGGGRRLEEMRADIERKSREMGLEEPTMSVAQIASVLRGTDHEEIACKKGLLVRDDLIQALMEGSLQIRLGLSLDPSVAANTEKEIHEENPRSLMSEIPDARAAQ